MADTLAAAAVVVACVNAVAALWGAWRWWAVEPSRAFWVLVRAGQATAIVLAVLAGVAAVTGFAPADGLFWLYALLPVAVGVVAEQLRLAAAQPAADPRGLGAGAPVGGPARPGQRWSCARSCGARWASWRS